MKCPNEKCNQQVQPDWKVCPFCQTPINSDSGVTPPGGIIDSVVKADSVHIGDKHIHEAPDPSKRKSATYTGMLCPICHRLVKDDWFECPECKRKYICLKHQDPKTNKCISCVKKSQSELAISSSEIGIGAVVAGRYKIVSVIGEGGMGTVFKAIDLRLSREVAVKCLSGNDKEDQAGIDRFMQEAKSIATLSHLNIVQVFDVSEGEGIPFICMELVDGKPLDVIIKDKGKYSPKEALPIIKGIAQALSYAHKRRVIHRDVKPANIIQNSDGVVKLLDFGLARIGQSSDLSRTGYGLGTEAYASPEQKRDAKSVDHRTDIYSLGATAYEMLTNESPIVPRENKLPPEISNVIMKALEPLVEQRYFTIDEFINDYEEKLSSPMQKKQVISTDTIGKCAECGNVNAKDSKYCEKCGAGLFEKCPSCSEELRIGVEFCPKCGTSIVAFKQYNEHFEKGNEYLKKKRYDRALKEFGFAREINGTNEELQSLIDETETSLEQINKLIDEGKGLYESEEYESAEGIFREALVLDPESSWLNQTITSIPDKIKERDEQKRKREGENLLSEGIDAYNQEDYELAESLLKEVLELDPNSTRAKELLDTIPELLKQQQFVEGLCNAKSAFDKKEYNLALGYIDLIAKISPLDEETKQLNNKILEILAAKHKRRNKIIKLIVTVLVMLETLAAFYYFISTL